jgi:hypothetical protein
MILKECIEILYWFLKVSAFIKNTFWYFDQATFFIGDDGSSSWNIINEWYFTKRVSWIIINTFLFALIFLIFSLDIVDSFKYNVKILTLITFSKDWLIYLMLLKLKVQGKLTECRQFQIKRLFDKNNFLHEEMLTFRMLIKSYLS